MTAAPNGARVNLPRRVRFAAGVVALTGTQIARQLRDVLHLDSPLAERYDVSLAMHRERHSIARSPQRSSACLRRTLGVVGVMLCLRVRACQRVRIGLPVQR
jgi:hypothetical protein